MTAHRVRSCTGILTGARYITSGEDMSLFPQRWNISDGTTHGSLERYSTGNFELQKKCRAGKCVNIRYEERYGPEAYIKSPGGSHRDFRDEGHIITVLRTDSLCFWQSYI